MARPKKHPAMLQNKAVKIYLTEEQYESFQEKATEVGMPLSQFLTYRPDLQANTLEYLKRIHDLTHEIHVTYAAVTGNSPTHSRGVSTQGHLSAPIMATSEKSDAKWAEYQAAKAAGNTLPEGDINPQVALLQELREKFDEMKKSES
jgi:dsRNA-specific ribonuclease